MVRELDNAYFLVLQGDLYASYENLAKKSIILLVGRLGEFGVIFRRKSLNFILHET